MNKGSRMLQENRSFASFILVSMVLLVLCIVAFFSINDYINTKANFDRESALLENQTEQNLGEAMRLTDIAWNIFDDNLNGRMEAGLDKVQEAYIKSGSSPAEMNLSSLKENLGEDTDIYIINESGVITYTTYPPELGQDFRSVPYFFRYLTKIRNSSGFFPDRIVHELLGSGQFRKYAYMPTPDHRYVLELGISGPQIAAVSQRLDTPHNIDEIIAGNPYVTGYRVFNSMGRLANDNSLPEPGVRGYLNETIANRSTLEVIDVAHAEKTHFVFVDLQNDQYGSDMSRVVEITYSTRRQQDALDRLIFYHAIIAIAAICLGCGLALYLSRRQIRPIREMVADVDIIARGNLEHRIGPTSSREFSILGKSINIMIDSIKASDRKLRDGETFQQEMIDQLPVGIFLKRLDDKKYVYWNRACEKMFCLKSVDVIGKTDRDLFSKEMAEIMEQEDRESCSNRVVIRNKMVSPPGGPDRMVHMIIVSIADSQGSLRYILGIADDVTPENLNLRMDLLFSITRHEILNQLTGIMNSLERAQLKSTHEDVQTFFDETLGSVESIKNQISFMRSLQDLGILSPGWLPLKQAFEDALRLIAPGSVKISNELSDIEVYADPLFPRIFFSLLENSFRRSGPGLSWIRVSAVESPEYLTIVYEDDGAGIPWDEKERIFEPGNGEGNALSFIIIRELLAFTGIRIIENGTPGKGTRFEMTVPKDKYRHNGHGPI